MKRILLISTAVDWDAAYENLVKLPFLKDQALTVPISLATIAGMTPDDIEVDIWDEHMHGLIDETTEFGKAYDLVGFTGYVIHLHRAKELARMFRQRGVLTAIGGFGVSVSPEVCRDSFDILFIGEAERTWPRFLVDWRTGRHRDMYHQLAKPDLGAPPIPKWENIAGDIPNYVWGAVQTTRGCPFSCEFCEIVGLFGSRARHKPIEHVLKEVQNLQQLGSEIVFFCDDNFAGSLRYAKDLLRELVALNHSFPTPLSFLTQVSVNIAKDKELLELLADANFERLFIGIESPNKESLRGANKLHNVRANLVEDVRKIQSYGLPVRASMIVGFDHDDEHVFKEQFDFLQKSCIVQDSVHILRAPRGTKLRTRLRTEGRLVVEKEYEAYGYVPDTNIVPKNMSRAELFSGYIRLMDKICDWRNFETRIKGFIDGVARGHQVIRAKNDSTRENPIFLIDFLNYLVTSVDQEGRGSVRRILSHVRTKAPHLQRTVLGSVIMHFGRIHTHHYERKELLKQIALESSDGFVLDIEEPSGLLANGAVDFVRALLPRIYDQIRVPPADRWCADEVIVRAFVNVLLEHQEPSALSLDQHPGLLDGFIDRVASEMGRLQETSTTTNSESTTTNSESTTTNSESTTTNSESTTTNSESTTTNSEPASVTVPPSTEDMLQAIELRTKLLATPLSRVSFESDS